MSELEGALRKQFGNPEVIPTIQVDGRQRIEVIRRTTRDDNLCRFLANPSDALLMHGIWLIRQDLTDAAKRDLAKRRALTVELNAIEKRARATRI